MRLSLLNYIGIKGAFWDLGGMALLAPPPYIRLCAHSWRQTTDMKFEAQNKSHVACSETCDLVLYLGMLMTSSHVLQSSDIQVVVGR